jgi:hypothetical protein
MLKEELASEFSSKLNSLYNQTKQELGIYKRYYEAMINFS